MKFKTLLLFACIFNLYSLQATETSSHFFNPENKIRVQDTCTLPPPDHFHIKGIGPDWVTLAWDIGTGVNDHRIRIYKVSDGSLLSTTIVPAMNAEATIGIPANTEVRAVINTICIDGTNSPDNEEKTFTGVILDLVVNGFIDNNNTPSCTINGSSTCVFNSDGVTVFKVSVGMISKKIKIQPTYREDGALSTCFVTSQTGNGIKLYCNTSALAPCGGSLLTIKYQSGNTETPVGTITVYRTNGINYLKGELGPSCMIERVTSFSGRPAPSKGSVRFREDDAIHTGEINVSPNPFTETLEVALEWPSKENVSLQLYNLSGQKVLAQQFPAGQDQYTLSTEKLNPGFYLLRIEADGEVQTLKVIKSE